MTALPLLPACLLFAACMSDREAAEIQSRLEAFGRDMGVERFACDSYECHGILHGRPVSWDYRNYTPQWSLETLGGNK